ncbi:MAG: class I mannose-6-phosphate isomerase [Nibricoccus sp.]
MLVPLKFLPIYKERVWGGQMLARSFDRILPKSNSIGESWEIVDRPEAQSVIAEGPLKGLTLRSAIERYRDKLMGPAWPPERPFPILVKWLDCRERLSLQVHPPACVAPELKAEPKTENWYIAHAEPDAALIVGLRQGVTRERFETALRANALEQCVHRFGVATGDSILVHSGQIHAIDSGNLILEIQQNSDTTYRVYDWGRAGLDGKPRQLHITESLKSIRWDDFEPKPLLASKQSTTIADAKEFRIRRIVLEGASTLKFDEKEEPRILSVVTGELNCTTFDSLTTVRRGENIIIPYGFSYAFTAATATTLLVTENFARA